jgi:hypothetical protein
LANSPHTICAVNPPVIHALPNGLDFTRAATAGKSIRYKTNYKARVAAADQPRKRRRVEGFVGAENRTP